MCLFQTTSLVLTSNISMNYCLFSGWFSEFETPLLVYFMKTMNLKAKKRNTCIKAHDAVLAGVCNLISTKSTYRYIIVACRPERAV